MIILVRHGSHAELGVILSGRSEIPLSEAGEAQALRLAERLADVPLTKVHSSPRRRAIQTAAPVAERHRLTVEATDHLDEIDFGEWAGQSFDALGHRGDWRAWNAARASATTPSGETMKSATSRALRHLEAFSPTDVVLCVSHGDIIRGVVAHYLGVSMDRLLAFDIDPASRTTIELTHGVGRVVAINERLS